MNRIVLIMITLLVSGITGFANGQTESASEIQAIRDSLEMIGNPWVASENGIMRMSPMQRRALLTAPLRPDATITAIVPVEIRTEDREFPATFDWRNIGGIDWMTSVKNQGGCGSCAAFASVGSVEAMVRIVRGEPTYEIDLSEQHLFSCCNGDCPTGLYMGDAFDYFTANGVPDEECLPYSAVDDNCDETCPDWQSRAVLTDSWQLLWQYTWDDSVLKTCIMEHPIACYLEVYNDFFSYSGGVYIKTPGATLAGGHFVVIVGWNDELNCWICKNSWDKDWGIEGYFMIRKGETNIGTWAMRASYSVPPTPTQTSTPDPSWTATPTPPPTPSSTATTAQSATPTGTPSSADTATPEPSVTPAGCPETGVMILLSGDVFRPGDACSCQVRVCNATGSMLPDTPLAVVLEISGEYYFAPSFGDFDVLVLTFLSGETTVEILPEFIWPAGAGTFYGARFYAAMLDPGMTSVLGNVDTVTFAWEE